MEDSVQRSFMVYGPAVDVEEASCRYKTKRSVRDASAFGRPRAHQRDLHQSLPAYLPLPSSFCIAFWMAEYSRTNPSS